MFPLADHNPTRHIRRPYVNWALIVLCVVVFVLPLPWYHYAFTPADLHLIGNAKASGGEAEVIAQMVTYIFLHASWLHLLGNMLALWIFGDNIEDSMGHWRYAVFFILCGMAGAGGEALFSATPHVPVVGASGAIAGVMGAYLLLHPRAKVLVLIAFRVPVLVPAGVFVGLSVIFDLFAALSDTAGEAQVAFWAHLGGFAAGALLITVMRWRDVPLFQPPAPHQAGFFGTGRWMLDTGREGGPALWFWVKAVAFFLIVAVLIETFLA